MAREVSEDKSSAYFSLLEALAQSGCPLCSLLQGHSTSYLDSLFYEHVTDVGTRHKLRQARSLCNWHAWEASKKTPAALGIAIIAHDLLDEERTRLAALGRTSFSSRIGGPSRYRIARRSLRAYLYGWRRRGTCPVCQVLVEHERYALKTLLDRLPEADLAARFGASAGLCLPHTVRALEFHPSHPALNRLIEMQHEKSTGLMAELDEFRRKHDYRLAGAGWSAESDSWLRAIEMLVGKRGLYGSDMSRGEAERSTRQRGLWRLVSGAHRWARALIACRPQRHSSE